MTDQQDAMEGGCTCGAVRYRLKARPYLCIAAIAHGASARLDRLSRSMPWSRRRKSNSRKANQLKQRCPVPAAKVRTSGAVPTVA